MPEFEKRPMIQVTLYGSRINDEVDEDDKYVPQYVREREEHETESYALLMSPRFLG